MKKLFTIFLFCVLVAFPQELRKVVSQSYGPFTDVCFADENTGWVVGYAEAIYKTTNGGTDWEMKSHSSSSTAATFYSVQFLDANTGFAGGGYSLTSALRKTTDGGDTWTDITFPAAYPIAALSFLDEQNGWVLASSSSQGQVYKTTDGGGNWTKVLEHLTGDLEDLQVRPSGSGICLGGGVGKNDIYYTTDGDNWTKAASPDFGGFTYTRLDPHAVFMVDDNLVYTCGWGSYVGLQPGIFLKSTDGGVTWDYLTQLPENRVYQNTNTLYFKNADNGISFGGGSYEGIIATRTTDGGNNWVPLTTGLSFTAQGCFGIGDKVWVVGSNGAIAVTSDFGDTWKLLTPIIGTTLNEINIINNTIYAGGFNGVLYKSTDRGINWTAGFTAVGRVCPNINGMQFLNESLGFFAKNNQMVVKTTDGGITFSKIMKDTSATGTINNGVYFFDENNGFVAGRYASNADIIYRTSDGGSNWSSVKDIVTENLNDITFFDSNNGISVANDRKILYTTNGGDNWNVAAISNLTTDLDIISVVYSSSTHAVAVGENCVLISNDGGINWEYHDNPVEFKTVVFKNENEGWAVGERSILYTSDGGTSWTEQNDTLITEKTTFNAAAIDDNGYLWVGGGSSVFTFSPLVSINEHQIVPENFGLYQNYPNPFNPETIIKYSVAFDSKVSIRIYDILGNFISQLVNENKHSGEYEISFNGTKLTSGVYFCVMNAGNKIFTRKMTLLK